MVAIFDSVKWRSYHSTFNVQIMIVSRSESRSFYIQGLKHPNPCTVPINRSPIKKSKSKHIYSAPTHKIHPQFPIWYSTGMNNQVLLLIMNTIIYFILLKIAFFYITCRLKPKNYVKSNDPLEWKSCSLVGFG